jgi:hypothetical protein
MGFGTSHPARAGRMVVGWMAMKWCLLLAAACSADRPDPVPLGDLGQIAGEYDVTRTDCRDEVNPGDCDLLRAPAVLAIEPDRFSTNCREEEWVIFEPDTAFSMDGCVHTLIEAAYRISTRNVMLAKYSFVGPILLFHLGDGVFEGESSLERNGRAAMVTLRLEKRH